MFAIKPIVLLCVFDVNDDSINKKKEKKDHLLCIYTFI